MNTTLRALALASLLAGTLSACSSGTHEGDTNVEKGSTKTGPAATADGVANGDSATAGIPRDTSSRPSGKELLNNAENAQDKNHDGIAD